MGASGAFRDKASSLNATRLSPTEPQAAAPAPVPAEPSWATRAGAGRYERRACKRRVGLNCSWAAEAQSAAPPTVRCRGWVCHFCCGFRACGPVEVPRYVRRRLCYSVFQNFERRDSAEKRWPRGCPLSGPVAVARPRPLDGDDALRTSNFDRLARCCKVVCSCCKDTGLCTSNKATQGR